MKHLAMEKQRLAIVLENVVIFFYCVFCRIGVRVTQVIVAFVPRGTVFAPPARLP
jgi:hypothetical protein